MDTRQDLPREGAGRRTAGRRAAWLPAAVLLALALVLIAAGCGDEVRPATSVTLPASTPKATPPAPTTSPQAGVDGPPKSTGGVCERTTADRKSLPSWARITVERFVAAVDTGDLASMRGLFDPAGADEAIDDLRPVARLGLLALEDRY